MHLAGIEAGGTKIRCAVGTPTNDGSLSVVRDATIATASPAPTLAAVRDFFSGEAMAALGVASFGPLDIAPSSSTYGRILDTPKLAWRGVDWREALGDLAPKFAVHTDVVAAAMAEARAHHASTLAYLTVGTGIGAGLVMNGAPLPGTRHAELGHIPVRRHEADHFDGVCPAHGACLEGLASAPALVARWGRPAHQIEAAIAWEIEAFYLAQAIVVLMRTAAPERVVLGGGVLARSGLLAMVRAQVEALLGGYYLPAEPVQEVVVAPRTGRDAGLLGALLLAQDAR